MSSLIEHAQRFEVVQLEAILNEEPQCESEFHDDPGPFESHGGPATHWQIGTCVHATGLRCATIVHSYVPGLPFRCRICGDSSPYEAFRWIEL